MSQRIPAVAITIAASLALSAGCTRDGASRDASDSPAARLSRTLASMSPGITRDLTPALARERFGAPDLETGSGLIIYKYAVESGDTLALAFPGYAPITYAQRLGVNGTRVQLPLR